MKKRKPARRDFWKAQAFSKKVLGKYVENSSGFIVFFEKRGGRMILSSEGGVKFWKATVERGMVGRGSASFTFFGFCSEKMTPTENIRFDRGV